MSNPFFTSQTLGTIRFDAFDGVGFAFVATSAASVISLGRWKIVGNNQDIVVTLWDIDDLDNKISIRSVSVGIIAGVAGAYVYASITPYTLVIGKRYAVLSSEPGIDWYNGNGSFTADPFIGNTVIGAYRNGGSIALGDNVFVPTNFLVTLPNAATPTFLPVAGAYVAVQNVVISSTTPSSSIYYTTDGSTPTSGSTLYTGPVEVAVSLTLKAITVASGFTDSAVGSAAYTITLPSVWSQPDCRSYGIFPNDSRNVQETLIYDVCPDDSRTAGAPVDSRTAGAPDDCRIDPNIPENSRNDPF